MQIISVPFWAFVFFIFTALFLCNKLCKNDFQKVTSAKAILLVASYLFIFYADIRFAFVLIFLTTVTWWCSQSTKRFKWGIIIALTTLGYFKYTNFFIDSFASFFWTRRHNCFKNDPSLRYFLLHLQCY